MILSIFFSELFNCKNVFLLQTLLSDMDTPSEKKTQPSQNENQSLSSALNQIDPRSFIKPNKVRNPNKLTRTDYCHYYMPKKKRFCQVRPKPGFYWNFLRAVLFSFCNKSLFPITKQGQSIVLITWQSVMDKFGFHVLMIHDSTFSVFNTSFSSLLSLCIIHSISSVYQNRLKKHLKKCISIKSEPYIQIDINAGSW